MRLSSLLAASLLLAGAAFCADPVTTLGPDQLLASGRAYLGEAFAFDSPATSLGQPPPRLLGFTTDAMEGYLSVSLPVPAEGHYSLRSSVLWGPQVPGRLGRFWASAGGVQLPGRTSGWYGNAPEAPFRLVEIEWGIARFSPPAAEVRLSLADGGGGRLLVLRDLRLVPVDAAKLKPEDRDRRVPALAAEAAPPAAAVPGQIADLTLTRLRGLEWTTPLRRAAKPVKVDGTLDEWPSEGAPLLLDKTIPAGHGWASPVPQGDKDLSARVRFAWDDKYLYVAARVFDDQKAAKSDAAAWGNFWGHDGLVLQAAPPAWLTGGLRSSGPAPLSVSLGFNYYSPGAAPRPLGGASKYAVTDTADGYLVEAAVDFAQLGWKPPAVGDRFPFALILVDLDPQKAGGMTFDQYGWNYGAGSSAGMGEGRLMGIGPGAGEVMPEFTTVTPGRPLAFIGTIDASGPCTLSALAVVSAASGKAVATYPINKRLDQPGRYRITGRLPAVPADTGHYDLVLVWQ